MRTGSPHLPHVVGALPALLVRAIDAERAGREVDALVAAGWRTGQLRSRIGAEPSQGSAERDAVQVLEVLRGLSGQTPPDVAHARELEQRRRDRARAQDGAPRPASPEVRARCVERVRRELGLLPGRRPVAEPRTRPSCSLCDGEGDTFVSREVRLCRRCVDVLAAGGARLVATG